MKYKKDFSDWLRENLDDWAKNHCEIWRDRYYMQSLHNIKYDLSINYDWSADFECLDNDLGRQTTDDERLYFQNKMTRAIVKTLRGQ